MMISRVTFLKFISMVIDSVDTWRAKLAKCDVLTPREKDEIIKDNVAVNDTITMLEAVTGDRYGVIRDYVFERDKNGRFFFAISTPHRESAVVIDSPKVLYEYLNDAELS